MSKQRKCEICEYHRIQGLAEVVIGTVKNGDVTAKDLVKNFSPQDLESIWKLIAGQRNRLRDALPTVREAVQINMMKPAKRAH